MDFVEMKLSRGRKIKGTSNNSFWLRTGPSGRLESLFPSGLRREQPGIFTNMPDSSLLASRKNPSFSLQKQLLEVPLSKKPQMASDSQVYYGRKNIDVWR